MSLPASRLRQSPQVLFRNVGPEVLLAALDRRDVQRLSPTGSVVWDLLSIPRSVPELTKLLADLYGSSEEAIRVDLEAFLASLAESGFLEEAPGTAP